MRVVARAIGGRFAGVDDFDGHRLGFRARHQRFDAQFDAGRAFGPERETDVLDLDPAGGDIRRRRQHARDGPAVAPRILVGAAGLAFRHRAADAAGHGPALAAEGRDIGAGERDDFRRRARRHRHRAQARKGRVSAVGCGQGVGVSPQRQFIRRHSAGRFVFHHHAGHLDQIRASFEGVEQVEQSDDGGIRFDGRAGGHGDGVAARQRRNRRFRRQVADDGRVDQVGPFAVLESFILPVDLRVVAEAQSRRAGIDLAVGGERVAAEVPLRTLKAGIARLRVFEERVHGRACGDAGGRYRDLDAVAGRALGFRGELDAVEIRRRFFGGRTEAR